MKRILVPVVLVPAAVLILLTVVRAWLEVNSPESASYVSVNALALVWMLFAPAVMLKRGVSLGTGMLAALLFLVLHRAAIGAVYALAVSGAWTIAGTDLPVRYVEQARGESVDASPFEVFLGATLVPAGFGLVIVLVVWVITWLIAFRKQRGLVRSAVR